MFSKRTITLFLCALCLVGVIASLKAAFHHNVSNYNLSFTKSANVSCNIDGWSFVHKRTYYNDGHLYEDFWYKDPKDPVVKISAQLHGWGWVRVRLNGSINGSSKGSTNYGSPSRVGSWISMLPFAHDSDGFINATFTGSFNPTPGNYPWDGNGSVEATPVYWKWRVGLPIGVSGTWENGLSTTQSDSDNGSWDVYEQTSTLDYPKHPEESGSGNGNGDSTGNGGSDDIPNNGDQSNGDQSNGAQSNGDQSNGDNPETTITGECSHTYPPNQAIHHAIVACTAINERGQACINTNYYKCQSHIHEFPNEEGDDSDGNK